MLLLKNILNLQSKRFSSVLKQPVLHTKNWKEDVIYLYQFSRAKVVPNMSPFCLKVETFLRANNLKYEVKASYIIRSAEGRLPFIELNGKQIADSQFIIWHLIDHFKIDEGLSSEDQGLSRALERMIEGSTYFAITYFRGYENANNCVNRNISGAPIPGFLVPFVARRLAKLTKAKLMSEGTMRHSREQIIELLRRDINALSQILGDKKFLMGIKPTLPDFTLFAHIGLPYYLPFDQPVKGLLEENGNKNLRLLVERIRLHYWPEWKRPTNPTNQNTEISL